MASKSPSLSASRDLSHRRSSRWLLWWVAGVSLLAIQRPLDAPGLWWHLSRGREVFAGTLFPSKSLLALESAAEADWLGGVPSYLIWTLGGVHALASIPFLMAAALVLLARRRLPLPDWLLAVVLLPLFLWTVRDGLEPVPELFDLLGLLALWRVLRARLSLRSHLLAVGLTFALWANLGPRPIWGLLLLALYAPRERGRDLFFLLAVAVLGGMLTPRGIFTWRDAAVLFAPLAFENIGPAGNTPWGGAFSGPSWSTAEIAFALLWCGWIIRGLLSSKNVNSPPLVLSIGRWSVPMLAAVLCRENIPICGLWIFLDVLTQKVSSVPARQEMASRLRRAGIGLIAVVMLGLVLIDASGRGLAQGRLGWGIAQEIDPRLLDVGILTAPQEQLIGWAPDERSVGIVSWLKGNVKMADHPERALLAGRWRGHVDLIGDFLGLHRAAYRREDGSWGGWVRRLDEWQVEQLFVPVESADLNRGLIKSTWKPADLDSPTIPYVSPDNPAFARTILQTLQQQGFVELGPWQPTPEIYAGQGWRFDAVELVGLGPDPWPAIRQSQLFRWQNIPLASLRALLPVRQHTNHRCLQEEFRICQEELAYQEWTAFGQASLFRRLVVKALITNQERSDPPPWLAVPEAQEAMNQDGWNECITLYRKGQIEEALKALPRQTAEQHYAAAMLWLELGESDQAVKEFQLLSAASDSKALQIAAKYWEDQISPFLR